MKPIEKVIFETGGTLSSRFDWRNDGICYEGMCQIIGSPIAEYLDHYGMLDNVSVIPLFFKNSDEWTDQDLELVLKSAKETKSKKVKNLLIMKIWIKKTI